jgi:hypothetical protein
LPAAVEGGKKLELDEQQPPDRQIHGKENFNLSRILPFDVCQILS